MLALDSPRWAELTHAYGKADDIPALLRRLVAAPPPRDYREEPWFSLWSALCHQNDVYTASFAATPHIAQTAAAKEPAQRSEHIHFVGAVEALRHRKRAPAIPKDLEAAYMAALDDTAALIVQDLALRWDEVGCRLRLGAFAALRGQPKLGLSILDGEGEVTCPNCGEIFAAPGYELLDEQG